MARTDPAVVVGDAAFAGAAHEVELWNASQGVEPVNADDVLQAYSAVTGLK